jgi:cysteine desulfurase
LANRAIRDVRLPNGLLFLFKKAIFNVASGDTPVFFYQKVNVSRLFQTDSIEAQEIYLDNHATTAVDPRVVDAMVPMMIRQYANAGSITHEPGRLAARILEQAKGQMLELLGTPQGDLVFTSGATESINLALAGVCLHPRQKRRRLLIGSIDHRAVLDCARKLHKSGLSVQSLQPQQCLQVQSSESQGSSTPIGAYRIESLQEHLSEDVALVSLILGNNEIGSLQDMRPVADLCHSYGALLHLDATQAVGKIHFDALSTGADLVSFSAHKFYGPKGVGGLLICNDQVKLTPQIVGGGQQNNLRSGTLNTAGIVGMAKALEVAIAEITTELPRIVQLRQQLWKRLQSGIDGLKLNGPSWLEDSRSPRTTLERLPGNLNVQFPSVDGQSLMLRVPSVALSSGSACSSAEPQPSHVLLGIGLSEDQARCSLRFGIGRFNTASQIDLAADLIISAYKELVDFVG